jgi:CBS domain containing-hemolysin-like protein
MIEISIILIMIVLSAIFSGLEIAYVTSDKMLIEVEQQEEKPTKTSQVLSRFVQNPSRFIATLLVGNNLALVIYGIYMEKLLSPQISVWVKSALGVLIIQTIFSTILILIFAEFLPKAIFRIHNNKVLRFFAFPMFGFYWIFKWIVGFFVWLSKVILKRFKVNLEEDKPIFGRVELEQYLESRTQEIEEEAVDTEVMIYKNVLDFSNVKVKECMVPRTEIEAIDLETSVEDLKALFIESGYSKILIYKETIDEIIGFVHSYELFKSPQKILEVLLPVGYIPQTMSAQEALNNFIQQQKSVFVVVDEFGGTAGMLTIEDIVEEIFGEIEDEHDVQEHVEQQINESEFLFSGRLEIDYLNEKYNLGFDVDNSYETLAGLLFTYLERIPEEGEVIELRGKEYTVEAVSDTKLELIRVRIPSEE